MIVAVKKKISFTCRHKIFYCTQLSWASVNTRGETCSQQMALNMRQPIKN